MATATESVDGAHPRGRADCSYPLTTERPGPLPGSARYRSRGRAAKPLRLGEVPGTLQSAGAEQNGQCPTGTRRPGFIVTRGTLEPRHRHRHRSRHRDCRVALPQRRAGAGRDLLRSDRPQRCEAAALRELRRARRRGHRVQGRGLLPVWQTGQRHHVLQPRPAAVVERGRQVSVRHRVLLGERNRCAHRRQERDRPAAALGARRLPGTVQHGS